MIKVRTLVPMPLVPASDPYFAHLSAWLAFLSAPLPSRPFLLLPALTHPSHNFLSFVSPPGIFPTFATTFNLSPVISSRFFSVFGFLRTCER